MNANQAISEQIIIAMSVNGGDLAKAIDQVIGAGAYDKLVNEVYEELKAAA